MGRGGLTPEAISTKQFKVSRRGYDPDDVSAFLSEVAAQYQRALEEAGVNQARANDVRTEEFAPRSFEELGAEAGALMQAAKEGADSLRRRAEQEAEALVKQATDEADRRMREVTLETERLRNAVKRQCEQMVSEAQARADRLTTHEREMREKVAELERMFLAFRNEMEASISEAADGLAVDGDIPDQATEQEQGEEPHSEQNDRVSRQLSP